MTQDSLCQRWQDITRQRQEDENRELEAQRAATHREVVAQIDALRSLTLANAALPADGPQQDQCRSPSLPKRHESISELEAPCNSPPPYWQHALLTPESDCEAPNANTTLQIRQLQKEVTQKESEVRRLESELEVEKDERRRLQAERHEAVNAQRRAKDDLCVLRRQVANLDELLNASTKREKELESELDDARKEITGLKRKLHDEQCNYESDIRAQEMRGKRIQQQLKDTHYALEEEIEKNRRRAAEFADGQGTAEAPSRPRRSDPSTSGRTFISVPRGGSRRRVYLFT